MDNQVDQSQSNEQVHVNAATNLTNHHEQGEGDLEPRPNGCSDLTLCEGTILKNPPLQEESLANPPPFESNPKK